ncbi:MAG: hypothetical protein KME14_20305 [Tildeniella torsiva UHER 1998/13D]|jgi:hypothetical protein|nr:hypothetical protein [Tildeniella torsiva UHER 1998/13D]
MPLPFDIEQAETVAFSASGYGTFALPKLGSVTPAEELAIIPILKAWEESQGEEPMVLVWVGLATIALKRLYPDQHTSQTQNLPKALVKELADFLLNERRGWEPIDEAGGDAEKKAPTGTSTKPKRGKPLAKSTGESVPAGPTDSPQTNSGIPL